MFPLLLVPLLVGVVSSPLVTQASTTLATNTAATSSPVATVPFYSQFKDISSLSWQKRGCGIASLAMVVDYFATSSISVNRMLSQGITLGAYSSGGWTYTGLISLAKRYGLSGDSKILYDQTDDASLKTLLSDLKNGPVIASVHYKFEPKNPIPHLVVITGIIGDSVFYNDPAAKMGGEKISVEQFLKAWKKRYLVIRPTEKGRLFIS